MSDSSGLVLDGVAGLADASEIAQLLHALTSAVRAYLDNLAQVAAFDPASTDLLALAAKVRRRIERRAAESEMDELSQDAQELCASQGEAAAALREMASCVRAYLDALARERDATKAVTTLFLPLEELEYEMTNRLWCERELRMLLDRS